MMTSSFKFTFNKPAVRQIFEMEGAKGIRLRVSNEDHSVSFQTVSDLRQKDALRLKERTRGGFEVTLDGDEADTILDTLRAGKPKCPFYLLRRDPDGWYRMVPYIPKSRKTEDSAPPKFDPHVRVWTDEAFVIPDVPERPAASPAAAAPALQQPMSPLAEMAGASPTLDDVRASFALLHRAASGPAANQSSPEVDQARNVVAAFEQTARELLPNVVPISSEGPLPTIPGVDMRSVAHTVAYLSAVLTKQFGTPPFPTGPSTPGPQPTGNGPSGPGVPPTMRSSATHAAPVASDEGVRETADADADAREQIEHQEPETQPETQPEPQPEPQPVAQEPVVHEPEPETSFVLDEPVPAPIAAAPAPVQEPEPEREVASMDDLDDAQVEKAKAALGLTTTPRIPMQAARRGGPRTVYPNKEGGGGRQKLSMGTFRK